MDISNNIKYKECNPSDNIGTIIVIFNDQIIKEFHWDSVSTREVEALSDAILFEKKLHNN